MKKEKLAKKVSKAIKFHNAVSDEIDRQMLGDDIKKVGSPYMRIEYIHGGEHQVVEFEPTGEVHGTSWVEGTPRSYRLRYFVAGMLWGAAISWVAVIVGWL